MRKYVNAEELVGHLRDKVHAGKAAEVVRRYAETHAVDAVTVGDLVTGLELEPAVDADGRLTARIKAYQTARAS